MWTTSSSSFQAFYYVSYGADGYGAQRGTGLNSKSRSSAYRPSCAHSSRPTGSRDCQYQVQPSLQPLHRGSSNSGASRAPPGTLDRGFQPTPSPPECLFGKRLHPLAHMGRPGCNRPNWPVSAYVAAAAAVAVVDPCLLPRDNPNQAKVR